jgi:hypothetical protein
MTMLASTDHLIATVPAMASEAGSHDEGVVDAGLCRRKPTPDPGPQQSAPKWGPARGPNFQESPPRKRN